MSDSKHWAAHEERGSFWLMKLTALGVKLLGRRLLSPILYGIVFYFFVFGRRARDAAREYQQRLADYSGQPALRPTLRSVFSQFMTFADALLDKLEEITGVGIPRDDLVEEASAWETGIDALAADDEDMAGYIEQLEQPRDTVDSPEASGEAIAQEFERYLRKRDGKSGDDPWRPPLT